MVICFKCPSTVKAKLDGLLQSGAFVDYSEIINAAIESFSLIHEEMGENGSIVLEGNQPSQQAAPSRNVRHRGPVDADGDARMSRHTETIPELFRLGESVVEEQNLAGLPSDVFFRGQPVPIDRWIFGQFSKLLPAKASCRALSRLHPHPSAGFELDKVAAQIAQEAETLSAYLNALDQKRNGSRDEALAVGFPSRENNADRSRLRYANQFVGSIGKQGNLVGLLIDLKLINLSKSGSKGILLTRPGLAFAVLENPVLDGIAGEGKFTQSEISFLLQHIQEHVPVEDFAFRTILNAVKEGHDTPDRLDEIVKEHVTPKRKDEITKAFITTQRSGAVSRMIDLGLISRTRDGVRVSYSITELGRQYVEGSRAA